MTQKLLEVTGLSRSFDALKAVNDISLEVREGEVVSIIGPNGSGKTTTLNLISGLLKPDAGSILYEGAELRGKSPDRIAEARLTRTFQNGRVFGNMTVEDNILVGLTVQQRASRPLRSLHTIPVLRWVALVSELVVAIVNPPAVRREAAELDAEVTRQLERFNDRLVPRRTHQAATLSYANRRRTEIARALAANPALLLLDEPTAGMNPAETKEVMHQLLDLKRAGQAMLLVEHKLDLVMTVSDRVIVMDHGEVIAEGTPAEVQNDERVIEAYLGRRKSANADRTKGRGQ